MAAFSTYIVGDRVRLSANFTGITSGPIDPTGITCSVGGQVVASYPGSVVRDAIGAYHFDWLASGQGALTVDWYSNQAGVEGHGDMLIYVQPVPTS